MKVRKLASLLQMLQTRDRCLRTVVVAGGHDPSALAALARARLEGIVAGAVLVGVSASMRLAARRAGLDDGFCRFIAVPDAVTACREAVRCCAAGEADVLMKGQVKTAELLSALLDPDSGLRAGRRLSHVAVFEVPVLNRLILITDAAVNVSPVPADRREIVRNAAAVACSLGIPSPKIALIAPVEHVSPKIVATVEAANLAAWFRRHPLPAGLVDGPLGLDNAVSVAAARRKKVPGQVAGRADVLVFPGLESANACYKALSFMAELTPAGMLAGASVPVALGSRSDKGDARFWSLVLALLASGDCDNNRVCKKIEVKEKRRKLRCKDKKPSLSASSAKPPSGHRKPDKPSR
jgi:phosphate butyryltransferase